MMMRLKGQSILVVEHEPSVARELEREFTQAGAKVFAAGALRDALYLAEYPALAAAVVNVQMGGDGESTAPVCRRLQDLADGLDAPVGLDERARTRLREGLDDIGLILRHDDAIRRYEAAHGDVRA